ncbi:MAG TPA: alpha/beta hydrolase fold domain-containing protein [Polyangiaceae bacterium]|nr:alpha/beta hydrolase fold domain-containing protein [Polyangiaceae bacterium]
MTIGTTHKLRILALHGFNGSARVLESQMRAFARATAAEAEFVCVDAPSLAAGSFGWWHAREAAAAGSPRGLAGSGVEPGAVCYEGWAEARDFIATYCKRAGPFDGVFGFSQGAALAALLAALGACRGGDAREPPPRFDFAIVVGGFASSDREHAPLFDTPQGIAVPSLHVIGRTDGIVPPASSRALAEKFREPVIVEHAGGHVVAATPAICDGALDFLCQQRRRRSGVLPVTSEPLSQRDAVPEIAVGSERQIELPLWPGRAHPRLRVFFPNVIRRKPRPALVVFRGGGYATPSGSGGGSAEWAARHGVVGIEAEYATRGSGESFPQNYADGARAMRLVRCHAADWGVDPERVALLGYSAGGHLASLLSTQPSLPAPPADDLAASVSARPNLLVLAYPLVSFVDGYVPGAFVGSVENFFGKRNADEAARRQFSSELHVESTHPPVFVWTTQDDALVPHTHSERFVEACRRAHVPVTFKLYPHGPHGLGLALSDTGPVREWTSSLLEWLNQRWGPP